MINIKKKLINEVEKFGLKNKDIISITLVGSMVNNSDLDSFNDLDLVCIIKKYSKALLLKLENFVNYIDKKYSNNDLGFTHTFNIGPIKVKSSKKMTIMFHFLLYDLETIFTHESGLARHSYVKYDSIYGKKLKDIIGDIKITKDDFYNEFDGFRTMISSMNSKKFSYLTPDGSNLIINEKCFDKYGDLENIFYVCLQLTSNLLRYRGIINNDTKKDVIDFVNLFNNVELKYLPSYILGLKKSLRNKVLSIREIDVEDIRSNVINFVSQSMLVLGEA